MAPSTLLIQPERPLRNSVAFLVSVILTRLALGLAVFKKWGGQADYDAYKAATPVLVLRPPRRTVR